MAMERNFKVACDFIRAAAKQGAELAVLPEYHLLNWIPHDDKFKEACSHWKKYLDGYISLAKECNICIVPGTIVELHNENKDDEKMVEDEPKVGGQFGGDDLRPELSKFKIPLTSIQKMQR